MKAFIEHILGACGRRVSNSLPYNRAAGSYVGSLRGYVQPLKRLAKLLALLPA